MIITGVLIGIDASRATGARLTGTERYSRELITALVRLAPHHRFRLYFRPARGLDPSSTMDDWPIAAYAHRVECVTLSPVRLWTHIGLARELMARPPDALLIPAHVLPASFAWPAVRRRTHAVVTIHDVGYRHHPSAHPPMQRLYLELGTRFSVRYAGGVIVDSAATRQDVARFYGAGRTPAMPANIAVAHPGPLPLVEVGEGEMRRVMAKFGLADGRPYALHVGTMHPRKNLSRLIQAWALIARYTAWPGARLVLAGAPGWGHENLPALIEALQLRDSVVLVGYVNDEEKSALIRLAHAYVFPSLYEGFGFPVLEAQSVGVPVACSNTSALPEVAGGAAALFDPLDVAAIGGALQQVMFDDATRTRLIEAGYRNLARFSWEACAGTVLAMLEKPLIQSVHSNGESKR